MRGAASCSRRFQCVCVTHKHGVIPNTVSPSDFLEVTEAWKNPLLATRLSNTMQITVTGTCVSFLSFNLRAQLFNLNLENPALAPTVSSLLVLKLYFPLRYKRNMYRFPLLHFSWHPVCFSLKQGESSFNASAGCKEMCKSWPLTSGPPSD